MNISKFYVDMKMHIKIDNVFPAHFWLKLTYLQ